MRGCQKKVLFLKNTGSAVFEEAYFVLKSDTNTHRCSQRDFIREANRIIDENIGAKRRINIKRCIKYVLTFIFGLAIGALPLLFLN